MILEFFWPKEIKQAIAECKANGSLNEEAMNYLRKITRIHVIIFITISFIFFITNEPIAGIFLIAMVPVFIWFDFRNLFYRKIEPYLSGERKKVQVKYSESSLYGTQRIWCEILDNKQIAKIVLGGKPRLEKKDWLNAGDVVSVFVSKIKPKRAMPDIDYLKRKYSLTTKIL